MHNNERGKENCKQRQTEHKQSGTADNNKWSTAPRDVIRMGIAINVI